MKRILLITLSLALATAFSFSAVTAQNTAPAAPKAATPKPDFPPHSEVLTGYDKVVSTAGGAKSMYTLWTRKKDSQVYAELPSNFASRRYFFALTIASGDRFAGLQSGDRYVYWRRYNKQLALISPNMRIRSTGDPESLSSVRRLFTDTVMLTVPIVTIGPGGGPIIDLDALLVGKASKFFGSSVVNRELSSVQSIATLKAFPGNIELAFEIPTSKGRLQTLHYSISDIPIKSAYKPRAADERIGYFTTSYSDLGKYSDDDTRIRYINRWHLEKRDPNLKISPPKNPIVFYIEHTTPVRYRRWVREGVLAWNPAFEKIGLSNAIEVYYQDKTTGAHMDKDPEDVRYNFVRWLNNDVGTAIGPSRVNPHTGQILDADIVLTDGWIRHFRFQFEDIMPRLAMEGFSAETLAWLAYHPQWDPRYLFASPAQRSYTRDQLVRMQGQSYGGHPLARVDNTLLGDDEYDGLVGRVSQVNGNCAAATGMAFDLAVMRMMLVMQQSADDEEKEDEEKDEDEEKEEEVGESILDGMPESFIGPLLADLVSHEVGHTLGLRHNFKGSSIYTLDQINSEEIKGKKAFSGSVMDYTPVNFRVESGQVQGDYSIIGIGPYDFWAIEYGYSLAKDLKPILARVSEPELQYATDEDTGGPDPLARRYDLSSNPLDYAQEQMRLARHHRGRILEHFVKEGDSWSKARRGYELTLSMQVRSLNMMANWIGGVHIVRDKKGDMGDRAPLEVVSVESQRAALDFVLKNSFHDEVFGLSTDLLRRMTKDKWTDGGIHSALGEPAWPIHDKIMGVQASVLTMLMNPTTLRHIYDNEFRIPEDQDILTLPEILETISAEIWSELGQVPENAHTARKPAISSLRRNLQREHVNRLVDMSLPGAGNNAAYKPISNLARLQLRQIQEKATAYIEQAGEKLDPYSKAHLSDLETQITKALDAEYIYNANKIGRESIQNRVPVTRPQP